MITKIHTHAIDRIENRLNGLVTMREVAQAVNRQEFPTYKTFIEVKRIPYTEIRDETVKPDGIARGDSIVAICECGYIKTVILRKSKSQSNEYHIYKIEEETK
jgi:hypothetical protein